MTKRIILLLMLVIIYQLVYKSVNAENDNCDKMAYCRCLEQFDEPDQSDKDSCAKDAGCEDDPDSDVVRIISCDDYNKCNDPDYEREITSATQIGCHYYYCDECGRCWSEKIDGCGDPTPDPRPDPKPDPGNGGGGGPPPSPTPCKPIAI